VRLELKVVMQNDRGFVDVMLLINMSVYLLLPPAFASKAAVVVCF